MKRKEGKNEEHTVKIEIVDLDHEPDTRRANAHRI